MTRAQDELEAAAAQEEFELEVKMLERQEVMLALVANFAQPDHGQPWTSDAIINNCARRADSLEQYMRNYETYLRNNARPAHDGRGPG